MSFCLLFNVLQLSKNWNGPQDNGRKNYIRPRWNHQQDDAEDIRDETVGFFPVLWRKGWIGLRER